MKFRTPLSGHVSYKSCSGSSERILYEPKFDQNGHFELVEIGKESVYDKIQSYAGEADINSIIKKYMLGDASVISEKAGQYADISVYPDNFLDMFNFVENARSTFDSLPLEVKQRFGNSFVEFGASFDKPDFLEKLGVVKKDDSDFMPKSIGDPQPIDVPKPVDK